MTDQTAPPGLGAESLTTADGRPLKAALHRAQARAKRRAFLLVLPLLAFVLLTFVIPIGIMLFRSLNNPDFVSYSDIDSGTEIPVMQNVQAWFAANPQGTEPDEAAYAALAADLVHLKEIKAQGSVGTRINYVLPGSRSLFTSSARDAAKLAPPYKEAVLALDEKWADPAVWQAMRSSAGTITGDFYILAADFERDDSGAIVRTAEKERIYLYLFWRTFFLSGLITLICLVLAFPIAHLLATLPLSKSNLLMILVLLPFWTSLLVRTTSWIVLLQQQGVVNDALVALGLIGTDGRLTMINNQTGTIVAMTHVLLPFMILPLYSVMRTIKPSYVRAARSLGATSWTAFRRVYLPQTLPGMGAGVLLVFILAVGYYITPALVGGADGQLISNMIAFHMSKANWSLAAAIATMLLFSVLILYWLYDRLIGIDNLKLG
ncbi:MAG: ABC transporter permease subunit [Proteobacteria bacterium]|nr:ABC transporter permease subunit [Pseudomonadota bacterium]